MTRVYMAADSNDAGVTVESVDWSDKPITITRARLVDKPTHLTPAEFRAVIEGGLRWMLENDPSWMLPVERETLQYAIEIVRGR